MFLSLQRLLSQSLKRRRANKPTPKPPEVRRLVLNPLHCSKWYNKALKCRNVESSIKLYRTNNFKLQEYWSKLILQISVLPHPHLSPHLGSMSLSFKFFGYLTCTFQLLTREAPLKHRKIRVVRDGGWDGLKRDRWLNMSVMRCRGWLMLAEELECETIMVLSHRWWHATDAFEGTVKFYITQHADM